MIVLCVITASYLKPRKTSCCDVVQCLENSILSDRNDLLSNIIMTYLGQVLLIFKQITILRLMLALFKLQILILERSLELLIVSAIRPKLL